MRNERVKYLVGNESLLIYYLTIFWLIKNELNLLSKSIEQIRYEISNGLCILALLDGELVGYVAILADTYDGRKLAKVSSHVVDPDTRRQGIGSKLAKEIYDLARELYPDYKVITVVNSENVRPFEKLGMVQIDKYDVPKEFIDKTSIDLNIDTPDKIIMIEP